MTRKQRNKVWRDLRSYEDVVWGGENIGGWVEDIKPSCPGKLFHIIYKSKIIVCQQGTIELEVPKWLLRIRVTTYNINVYPNGNIYYEYLRSKTYKTDFTKDII